jgi:hypothetical protein
MSWKSETRRKVENLLDAYDVEEVGAANIAAELEELTRPVLFARSCGREMSARFARPVAE